jgi:hypothetical protein
MLAYRIAVTCGLVRTGACRFAAATQQIEQGRIVAPRDTAERIAAETGAALIDSFRPGRRADGRAFETIVETTP